MGNETETIDKLFLELSQFTEAKTKRELELEAALRTVGCRGIHSTPTERRNCECVVCRTFKSLGIHE